MTFRLQSQSHFQGSGTVLGPFLSLPRVAIEKANFRKGSACFCVWLKPITPHFPGHPSSSLLSSPRWNITILSGPVVVHRNFHKEKSLQSRQVWVRKEKRRQAGSSQDIPQFCKLFFFPHGVQKHRRGKRNLLLNPEGGGSSHAVGRKSCEMYQGQHCTGVMHLCVGGERQRYHLMPD